MPRGGYRPNAGRPKGSYATVTKERAERERIAEQIAAQIGDPENKNTNILAIKKAMAGNRLAVDEMKEILPIVKNVLAHFQRQVMKKEPDGTLRITGDLTEFKEWLKIFADIGFRLADFQSPKFRAVMVAPTPEGPSEQRKRFVLTIFDNPQREIDMKMIEQSRNDAA
jgi:hypothetical protein